MVKIAGILVLGLCMGAAAQEPTGPADGDGTTPSAQDTALISGLRKQGESAYEALQEPNYRTREPVRAAGNSLEIVNGKGSAISPDKATRGGGDW